MALELQWLLLLLLVLFLRIRSGTSDLEVYTPQNLFICIILQYLVLYYYIPKSKPNFSIFTVLFS